MSRNLVQQIFRLATAFALLDITAGYVYSQVESEPGPKLVQGSLHEINGKRRAHVLVLRSKVVDASDPAKGAVEAVVAGERTEGRNRRTYNVIARELNKYIRKHGSMSAATDSFNADFVIVFNVAEYRRILNIHYPFGEMYVISNDQSGAARVLWRTDKQMIVEDAIKKLVQAMKKARGER